MTVKVDPFLLPIPKKLQEDSETRGFFEYFIRWAHDITQRTGGGTDAIADTGVRESYPWPIDHSEYEKGAELQSLFSAGGFDFPAFRAVSVSNEIYTALPYDFINASNKSTVYFPKSPTENCVILVRNADGSKINFNGNGRTINDSNTGSLIRKGTAIEFYYFIDDNEWLAK
jgi:hypothetical protein